MRIWEDETCVEFTEISTHKKQHQPSRSRKDKSERGVEEARDMNEDKGFDGEVGERYIGIAESRETRPNMQNEEITFQS